MPSSIAWSKNGFVAYSIDNTHSENPSTENLAITHLETCSSGWTLSEPKFFKTPGNISCLQWSDIGDYVAVQNSKGGITILGGGLSRENELPGKAPSYKYAPLNDFVVLYSDSPSTEDSLIVSLAWIPVKKGSVSYTMEYAKIGPPVSYKLGEQAALGPQHPTKTKQACIGVRRNGQVCLWYQGAHGLNFQVCNASIPAYQSSGIVTLSKASISFGPDNLALMAGYDPLGENLTLYKISVKWDSLQEKGVAVMSVSSSVRTAALNVDHVLIANEDIYTVSDNKVIRYHLLQQSANVFAGAEKFAGKESLVQIEAQEEFYIEGEIVCMNTACRNKYIYFVTKDGAVEVRTTPNYKQFSEPVVHSLYDAGYRIPKIPVTGAVTVSPNLTALVALNENSIKLELHLADIESMVPEKVAAAFAVTHSESYFAKSCCDDAVATIQKTISTLEVDEVPSVVRLILSQCQLGLKFSFDPPSPQIDQLFGNPILQKLISLQATLGTGINWKRSKSARIAWAILNLSTCGLSLMITLKSWYKDSEARKNSTNLDWHAGALTSTLGSAKWLIDFVLYIYQDLLLLLSCSNGPSKRLQKSYYYSVSLPLILARVPRSLLMNALKLLHQLHVFATRLTNGKDLGRSAVGVAREKLRSIYEEPIIEIQAFEKFLEKIDKLVSESIKRGGGDHSKIQQMLVCEGTIVPELVPAVKSLLQGYGQGLSKQEYRNKLMFLDLNWLGLNSHPGDVTYIDPKLDLPYYTIAKNERIDYLRKEILDTRQRIKRCVRCGSEASVDDNTFIIKGDKKTGVSTHWDFVFNKNCFCGAFWAAR